MALGVTLIDIIESMRQFGFFEIGLPFLLTFVIFYGLIETVRIFKDNQRVQAAIALIAATFVMISPMGPALANFFSLFFARMSAILIGTLFLLLTFYMMYRLAADHEEFEKKRSWKKHMIWVAGLAVLFAFSTAGGFDIFGLTGGVAGTGISPDTIALIGIVGILVLFVSFVLNKAKKEQKKQDKRERHKKALKYIMGK